MGGQGHAGESFGELSQRGFRLAYFITGDRSSAIQILFRAWNKLDALIKRQSRRSYWRDKYLKRWVTKISKTDADTLQWLIYFESESYEKRQEEECAVAAEALVVRYIKSIVKTATAMSSFYVAIGVHRLLHDYSTAEIQKVYELATERYLGADEYRRAKRLLIHALQDRFGDRLRSVRAAHGEIRFELFEDQDRWAGVVSQCLTAFIPWSTLGLCPLPPEFGARNLGVPLALSGRGTLATPDRVETNRCHAFIDLSCYRRLVQALGMDAPEKRLALPRLCAENTESENKNDTKDDDGKDEDTKNKEGESASSASLHSLTPEERESIREGLAEEARRRKRAVARSIVVQVDGVERGRIDSGVDAGRQHKAYFEVEEGARLVEFVTRDEAGEVLLGTYLIEYSESLNIKPSTATVRWGRTAVTISVSPSVSPAQGQSALLTVALRGPARAGENAPLGFPRRAFFYGALALILIFVGWTLRLVKDRHSLSSHNVRIETLQREIAGARLPASSPELVPQGVVSQALAPYDLSTRGGETDPARIISLPTRSSVLELELPTFRSQRRSFRAILKSFPQQRELLSEELVRPTGLENMVRFPVPASLLSNGKDYLVELRGTGAPGSGESRFFVFHVSKPGG